MHQQKQQKHTTSQPQITKNPSNILVIKGSLLPRINTRSPNHSKSHHNLQHLTSPKKIKVPDIYYEQLPQPSGRKLLNTIITEKDSLHQSSINHDNHHKDKQPTNLITNFDIQNQEKGPHLCQKHANTQQNQFLNFQSKISKIKFNQKNSRNRYCCQTEPSEQGSNHSIKTQLYHNSLPQTTKNLSNKILPQKLKPIKTNFYQKPQLFGPVPQKLLPPIDRSQFQRYFISKHEEKAMVEKLSKPKHQIKCLNKNFQCLNQSRFSNSLSPQNKNFSSFDLRQLDSNKIKINVQRLKKINEKNLPETEDNCLENGLKRKVKQKRNQKKKKNIHQLQRYETEPLNNDYLMKDNELGKNQFYAQSECQKHYQNVIIPNKVKEQQQSFITGLVTSSHAIIEQEKQKRKVQPRDDGFGSHTGKKVSIKIQTQEILIVKNQESQIMNLTQNIKPSNDAKYLIDQDFNDLNLKKSNLSHSSIKDFQKIAYTFGSRENSARKSEAKEHSQSNKKNKASRVQECYAQKTRQQIIESCKLKRQYWLYYEVESNTFYDLNKPFDKTFIPPKQKINLVSSVFKENIMIKVSPKHQKLNEKPSLDISQISSIPNLERLNSFPITIDIKDSKKNELPQTNTSVISKYRNSHSPNLTKSNLNMFSRSPKSMASSKARKCFRIPKESEYVDFVKMYKPINPQIQIKRLVLQDNFKVIPSMSKFFFGQITGESIKHGLGIEVSINQIFEGEYFNGNRIKGYLKVHDGVYEGTFENNLKHGQGIFRWDNGQIFQGEWKMGTKNGFGVWTSPDGSYYEGEWHLNMQHGRGKHVHSSGVYEGQFKNFRKEGKGKESFPNGDKFTGEYKNGKPNGRGKYEWSNGTYYEGEFINGLKEGKGTWHEDANTYYEGSLHKDQKHGQGIEYYKDGSYFEGIFVNGVISEGKHYNVNKEVIQIIGAKVE